MHRIFRNALTDASGESEFVIAIVIDIRGFSAFSQMRESPDTAMYIKRVYMTLIDVYFRFATYYKSTGDGLLLTVPFNEKNIQKVVQKVLNSCINCHSDFANITEGDPMINYEVPTKIGIGVARGTACRLFSGDKTIDYSGRLLNLTSRLNDLARPSGIVIDGDFGINLLTDKQQAIFQETDVYIKGIHEVDSTKIYFTPEFTIISDYNKKPIIEKEWQVKCYTQSYAQMLSIGDKFYQIILDSVPRSANDIKIICSHRMVKSGKVVKGLLHRRTFTDFEFVLTENKPAIVMNYPKLCKKLKRSGVKRNMDVEIAVSYIEK
jgi:class 3 adenylate cyclase